MLDTLTRLDVYVDGIRSVETAIGALLDRLPVDGMIASSDVD